MTPHGNEYPNLADEEGFDLTPPEEGFGLPPLARFFRESDESSSGSRRVAGSAFKLPKRTSRAASTDQIFRVRTSTS